MKNILAILLLLNCQFLYAQKNEISKTKFSINFGYGLNGSFAAIDYSEFSPLSQNKVFSKKNFIGTSAEGSVEIRTRKGWNIRMGLNYQYNSRKINSLDTLNGGVIFELKQIIHMKNYFWYGALARQFKKDKHLFIPGLGLYYLETKDESIRIFPGYISDRENVLKGNRNGEAGAFLEMAYEYEFQPKVNVGIRSQFYYTISLGYQESLVVYPYIKILF